MDQAKSLQQFADYKDWVVALKTRLRSLQLKAAVAVNSALLEFYWQLGSEIVEKQKTRRWGDGFLQQLSQDLRAEFPELKGFSHRNLKYIRRWYCFYSTDDPIGQQAVAQLTQILWGHNIKIVSKCKTQTEALYPRVLKCSAYTRRVRGWCRQKPCEAAIPRPKGAKQPSCLIIAKVQ